MKYFLLFFLSLILSTQVYTQNSKRPANLTPGKCYQRCFDYDKKYQWREIDCAKAKKEAKNRLTKAGQIKCEQEKLKLKSYQKKLKFLGYKIEVTGIVDNKTIIAHHKYLKKRKKRNR